MGHEPRAAWADGHATHQAGAMLCRTWNIEKFRPCAEGLSLGEAATVIHDVNGHQGRARLQRSLVIDMPDHRAPYSSATKRAPSPARRCTWAATSLQSDPIQPEPRTEREHASSFSLIA